MQRDEAGYKPSYENLQPHPIPCKLLYALQGYVPYFLSLLVVCASVAGGAFATSLDKMGYAQVSDTLQLAGSGGRVFALGDAMTLEGSSHTRLGHTAELQAKVVCDNIARLEKGMPLCRYPKQSSGFVSNMYCISLGPTAASFRYGNTVINGFFAAFVKWCVEWSKVAQARNRLVGLLLWQMSDHVTSLTVDKDSQPLLP